MGCLEPVNASEKDSKRGSFALNSGRGAVVALPACFVLNRSLSMFFILFLKKMRCPD
jgi:hypothetical protein